MSVLKSILAASAAIVLAGAANANVVISHDFDSAGVGAYSVSEGGVFGDGVDAASFPTGNALYMNGWGQRSVTFAPVDLSSGGNISFNVVLGDYYYYLPYYEGQDGWSEDLTFEYSTDGGANWTAFDIYSSSAAQTGTKTISGWTSQSYALAGGAAFASTTLRFLQPSNSGSDYDHWAIDNLTVTNNGAVPEPASWAMMIGGFALAGGAMRRRKAAISFA